MLLLRQPAEVVEQVVDGLGLVGRNTAAIQQPLLDAGNPPGGIAGVLEVGDVFIARLGILVVDGLQPAQAAVEIVTVPGQRAIGPINGRKTSSGVVRVRGRGGRGVGHAALGENRHRAEPAEGIVAVTNVAGGVGEAGRGQVLGPGAGQATRGVAYSAIPCCYDCPIALSTISSAVGLASAPKTASG